VAPEKLFSFVQILDCVQRPISPASIDVGRVRDVVRRVPKALGLEPRGRQRE
jgi:hypothetical protein